jgi:uncharacterized protein YcfL
MKTNFTFGLASLILLVLLGCRKENDILPVTARLKQVLLYDSINAKEPIRIDQECEYNELGQTSKVSYVYDGDHFLEYRLYEYNSTGQLSKVKKYGANSDTPAGYNLLQTYTYTYSTDGKKVKEFLEYPDRTGYILFLYTDGRLTRMENYDSPFGTDQLFLYTLYEYNASGQQIKEVLYFFNDVPEKWTINTFSNGLMVKTEVYSDVNLQDNVQKIYRTFDANNNLKILEVIEDPSRSPVGLGHSIYKYIYFGE